MKKKLLAALLVAILASSMAFAGFGGSAEAQFGWNIDDKTFGFDNNNAPKITLTLATENGENKGEGDVYGEIKATLEVKLAEVAGAKDPADTQVMAQIKDFDAKVVGTNWSVGITGAMGAADFASSYSLDDDGNPIWNYKLAPTKVAGVTVKVFDYGFGVGFNKGYDKDGKNGAYFAAKTPEYKFLEDSLTVQAGAVAAVQTKDFKEAQYGFGGKVAYALDPLSASVAADFGFKVANGEAKFDADVAANVSFSPVTLDVYYATNAPANTAVIPVAIENLLNAKLTTKLDDFVGMPLSFYVNFINLVNDTRFLKANATATVIDALTLGLTYVTSLQDPLYWTLAADASYDFDVVAVSGGVKYNYVENTLALSAKVSSEKLINNATLSLSYTGLTFDFDENADNKLGSVVASCKISF